MHSRTAAMTGTEYAGYMVQLTIAGKLANEHGEKVDLVTGNTVENWRMEAIDGYWKEVEVRVPQDAWGYLVEDQNV